MLAFSCMVYFCCCKGRSPAAQEEKRRKEREETAARVAAARAAADVQAPQQQQPPKKEGPLPHSSIAAAAMANGSKAVKPSLTGYATDLEDVAPKDRRDQIGRVEL